VNKANVLMVCPQCNGQFRRAIDVLDAVHAVECPVCGTGFESLLVTVLTKHSTGHRESNSRHFSVRVEDPFGNQHPLEFSRPSYEDIELRPDDDLILTYLQEQLVVVQNLTVRRYDRLIPIAKKEKAPPKRKWVWIAVGIISALPLLCFAAVLASTVLPITNQPWLFATEAPAPAPPTQDPFTPDVRESRLWCPDCAAAGNAIVLWEQGTAKTSRAMGQGQHGDEVEVLVEKLNPSEGKTYYFVQVKNSQDQGWVPETLLQFGPPEEPAPPPAEPVQTYVIRAGDTLAIIARNHGTTIQWLVEVNGIQDPNVIQVGQELIVGVPAGWTPAPGGP
jgi:LysM repeat protein